MILYSQSDSFVSATKEFNKRKWLINMMKRYWTIERRVGTKGQQFCYLLPLPHKWSRAVLFVFCSPFFRLLFRCLTNSRVKICVQKKKPLSLIKMHQPKWNNHARRILKQILPCLTEIFIFFIHACMHCATDYMANQLTALFSQNFFRFEIITWILVVSSVEIPSIRLKNHFSLG